jgi:hypothetical protein
MFVHKFWYLQTANLMVLVLVVVAFVVVGMLLCNSNGFGGSSFRHFGLSWQSTFQLRIGTRYYLKRYCPPKKSWDPDITPVQVMSVQGVWLEGIISSPTHTIHTGTFSTFSCTPYLSLELGTGSKLSFLPSQGGTPRWDLKGIHNAP